MTLRFPDVEDIPLARAPLTEVICQVRFPTILSIGGRGLVQFQDAIRMRFPEFDHSSPVEITFSAAPSAQAMVSGPNGQVYQFRTADGQSTATLETEAYALSTSKYTVWNDFANDLTLIHYAAMNAYQLPYAKRIGLRYVNQIIGADFGIDTLVDLAKLFRPELVSLVSVSAWSAPEETVTTLLLSGDEGERMIMRTGFRNTPGRGPTALLDLDYYVEGQCSLDNLVERCDHFHELIYRAFRWSLKNHALKFFEPL